MKPLTENQRDDFAEAGILQLAEGVEFLLRFGHSIGDALADDNRISATEIFGVAWSCFGSAKQAFSGSSHILAEAKNLEAKHIVMLADAFFDPRIEGGIARLDTEWKREMVNRAIGALVQLVHVWQGFRDRENWVNPPKANIIP